MSEVTRTDHEVAVFEIKYLSEKYQFEVPIQIEVDKTQQTEYPFLLIIKDANLHPFATGLTRPFLAALHELLEKVLNDIPVIDRSFISLEKE